MEKINGEATKIENDETVWALPTESAGLLQTVEKDCTDLLVKIGSLEADYASTKLDLLERLQAKRDLFNSVLLEAAKKGGLNLDRERWVLNSKEMSLVRKG
jgi:hypothetical protein